MKKKLLKTIGLFTAIMMLSGCTNLTSDTGTVPTGSSEVQPDIEITREAAEAGSVNLTEGRNEGTVEDTEVPAEKFDNLTNASVSLLYQTMLYETDKNRNISELNIFKNLIIQIPILTIYLLLIPSLR